MNKKTIGVIGLGSIGKRHADNLSKMNVVVRVYDPAAGEGASSAEELIEKSDAVVIASPTNLHQQQYMDVVIKSGDKPVFIEKPIAHVYDEMLKNVRMVGYNLRWHSCVKKAKEWLDAGHIGKPLWANFVCAQYNDRPAYLRDGVILNWSHEIDLSLYLLGPGSVSGSSTRLCRVGTASSDINAYNAGVDDLTDILLTHENGCRSTIHLDYITQPEIRQSMIVGKNATIILDLVSRNAWLRSADGVIWDHLEGQDSWDENYKEEMKAFIDRIDGKQTIGATGQEGLDVLNVCLEVRRQAGL